jgi:hypothetical protein
MGAFFLSSLGLKIIGALLVAMMAFGIVANHDRKVRAAAEAKWKPKVEECTKANTSLQAEYSTFIQKHNAQIAADLARSKAAKDTRDRLIADLAKRDGDEQKKIDAALTASRAAPLPPEKGCAQADAVLRALAAEVYKEDAER